VYPTFLLRTNSRLENFTFNGENILLQLLKLNPHKSLGPDGISPFVLRYAARAFVVPHKIIFSKSADQRAVPHHWSDAHINPIFKNGDESHPGNYRPISLTSVLCKLMERLVRDQLSSYLVINRLLSTRQHGFVKNKACNTNLLECSDFITYMDSKKISTDMILLDFAKAFDKVLCRFKMTSTQPSVGHPHGSCN